MGRDITFVDLCSGAGGLKHGLVSQGWECLASIDHDQYAVDIHNTAFGGCSQLDIFDVEENQIPKSDVLVAGFPCQPFSTSGNKAGFEHKSGNVFERIIEIAQAKRQKYLLLENVEGLLKNQNGYSFSIILKMLTDSGYIVHWSLVDSNHLGDPQTRSRIFIFAYKDLENGCFTIEKASSDAFLFRKYEEKYFTSKSHKLVGSISDEVNGRTAAIGRPRSNKPVPYATFGIAKGDSFVSWKGKADIAENATLLGDICCPDFHRKESVTSVRFYARGKPTSPHFRRQKVAHCLGGTIGAAPTFAIPLAEINEEGAYDKVLKNSNWHRVQEDHLIFRLTPSCAVRLFGENTIRLQRAFAKSKVSSTKKYVILGNMVSPTAAKYVGELVASFIKLKMKI